jgi:acetyl esterase
VTGGPAVEPDTAALIAAMDRAGVRSWSELGVEGSRQRIATTPRPPGPAVHRVADATMDGPHGPVAVRLYRPTAAPTLPAVVYFHGGGMVMGDLDSFDSVARRLAVASGAAVVSVDYRLAPEHRYPVANDEAYAAVTWVHDSAGTLGLDPARIAVAGDSAGGGLAAATALRIRDTGGPRLTVQLLMYPGLERYNPDRPSMRELAGGPMLTANDITWFKDLYLGDDPSTDTPYGAPLLAADLAGLPPAVVVTAGVDPLRDSAEAYGYRLLDAGVPVALLRYPGVCHGFMATAGVIGPGRDAFAESGALLRVKLAVR